MDGFRFADPQYLSWLFILPAYWIFNKFWLKRKQKQLEKAFGKKNHGFLTSSWDTKAAQKRLYLELVIITFFVIALARPQTPGGTQTIRNEGVEVLLLVDVSRSMLSEDVKPSRSCCGET